MKLPKVREIIEALTSLFSKPFTNGFPFKAITIPDGFRGKPQYYEDDCVGCLACFEVCPSRAISYVDNKQTGERILTHHQDICIFCQQCERACITEKGIKLTKEFELSTNDRGTSFTQCKKKLVLCQHCGEIIAPFDQLVFLAKKIGNLQFANPTLMLSSHKALGLLADNIAANSPHPRSGHLQVTCPNCRRETILKEQW